MFLDRLINIVNNYSDKKVEELKQNHKDAGQVATGQTLSEFGQKTTTTDKDIKSVIFGADHIEFDDRGRGDGGMSPIGDLMVWIEAKGLQTDNVQGFAYAIAKKHAAEGSYQHRTGKTFAGFVKPVSSVFQAKDIKELDRLIEVGLIQSVESDIIEEFKAE